MANPTANSDDEINLSTMGKTEFNNYVKRRFQEFETEISSEPFDQPIDFDRDDYAFDHEKRGLALIISNEKFKTLPERNEYDADVRGLKKSFTEFGFDIRIFRNLSRDQMLALAKEVRLCYPHQKADCFVCFVLTHGSQSVEDGFAKDVLLGCDEKKLETKEFIECFKDTECSSLIGKPRLFFIDACRGSKNDISIHRQMIQAGAIASGPANDFVICPSPLYQDCMIMYSSPPGFHSFNHYSKGSWLTQGLCEYLNKLNSADSFLSGLPSVCWEVAKKESDSFQEENKDKMQVPVVDTMLIKDIFMTRKTTRS